MSYQIKCIVKYSKIKDTIKTIWQLTAILAVINLHYCDNEKSINKKEGIYFNNKVVLNFM